MEGGCLGYPEAVSSPERISQRLQNHRDLFEKSLILNYTIVPRFGCNEVLAFHEPALLRLINDHDHLLRSRRLTFNCLSVD